MNVVHILVAVHASQYNYWVNAWLFYPAYWVFRIFGLNLSRELIMEHSQKMQLRKEKKLVWLVYHDITDRLDRYSWNPLIHSCCLILMFNWRPLFTRIILISLGGRKGIYLKHNWQKGVGQIPVSGQPEQVGSNRMERTGYSSLWYPLTSYDVNMNTNHNMTERYSEKKSCERNTSEKNTSAEVESKAGTRPVNVMTEAKKMRRRPKAVNIGIHGFGRSDFRYYYRCNIILVNKF